MFLKGWGQYYSFGTYGTPSAPAHGVMKKKKYNHIIPGAASLFAAPPRGLIADVDGGSFSLFTGLHMLLRPLPSTGQLVSKEALITPLHATPHLHYTIGVSSSPHLVLSINTSLCLGRSPSSPASRTYE